jgi:hypothetical protein
MSSRNAELKTVKMKMNKSNGQIALFGSFDNLSIARPSAIIAMNTLASIKAKAKNVHAMSMSSLMLPSRL